VTAAATSITCRCTTTSSANSGSTATTLLAKTLEQKDGADRDRIYRLLALVYPWKDIAAAQWTLRYGDPRSRASASEYLDNILTGQLRKRIMPVLEDLPADEKVRRGNVLLKTRPRDVEETLLQLINDDDQVVAACAIDVVGSEKMWTLGDDVEHVLAHRDVRDWYVFEAASWGARGTPDARGAAPGAVARAAARGGSGRRLRALAAVRVGQRRRAVPDRRASRQIRHQSGTVLLQEGTVPDTVHFMLDGRVTAQAADAAPYTIESPRRWDSCRRCRACRCARSIRTVDTTVTLAMTARSCARILADNTDLVRGSLRRSRTCRLPDRAPTCSRSARPRSSRGWPPAACSRWKKCSRCSVSRCSRGSRRRDDRARRHHATAIMTPGQPLFAESASSRLWVISPAKRCSPTWPTERSRRSAPGNIIGSLCMLSGRPLGKSAAVVRGGAALRIDRDDLFDLLGERPELLRQLFEGIFRIGADAAGKPIVRAVFRPANEAHALATGRSHRARRLDVRILRSVRRMAACRRRRISSGSASAPTTSLPAGTRSSTTCAGRRASTACAFRELGRPRTAIRSSRSKSASPKR
jgi:CRP-like cAMP-binding protein